MCVRFRARNAPLFSLKHSVFLFQDSIPASWFWKYLYITYILFLLCLLPVWSPDWKLPTHTQSYQQRKVITAVTHIAPVILCWQVSAIGLFFTNSSLCRKIFMGARHRTVWRPTCANSSAGCMHIFCKYITAFYLPHGLVSSRHSSWTLWTGTELSACSQSPTRLHNLILSVTPLSCHLLPTVGWCANLKLSLKSQEEPFHISQIASSSHLCLKVFTWSQSCRWDYYKARCDEWQDTIYWARGAEVWTSSVWLRLHSHTGAKQLRRLAAHLRNCDNSSSSIELLSRCAK